MAATMPTKEQIKKKLKENGIDLPISEQEFDKIYDNTLGRKAKTDKALAKYKADPCEVVPADMSILLKSYVDSYEQTQKFYQYIQDLLNTIETYEQKLKEANNIIATLRDGNLDLIEQLRKARQERIRFVQIRPSKSLQDELYELYEMVDTLQKENDAIRGIYDDVDEMKQTVETANQICAEYEAENKSLKMENQKLTGKIMSLNIQINSYKDREANKQIPLLYRGTEEDKYSGEAKDMVLECLHDKLKTLDTNFRSYAVIKSIIEANPIDGTRMKIRKDLEQFLLNYGKLAKADGSMYLLTRNGLEVHVGSNHGSIGWKGDSRFNTSISSTPSDKVRGNLNQFTTISRMLL